MLNRLSTRLITFVPRRTKVLRPSYPKINPGPIHIRAPPKELRLWEVTVAVLAFTTAMLGPAFYYVPKWKDLQPVEDDE